MGGSDQALKLIERPVGAGKGRLIGISTVQSIAATVYCVIPPLLWKVHIAELSPTLPVSSTVCNVDVSTALCFAGATAAEEGSSTDGLLQLELDRSCGGARAESHQGRL